MKKKEPKKKILEYVFSILAPGTPLRSAIDRVQEASLGAIVVLGDPSDLSGIIRGGFKLNTPCMNFLKWTAELYCPKI